jgi:Ca-activated chloride channel family protein
MIRVVLSVVTACVLVAAASAQQPPPPQQQPPTFRGGVRTVPVYVTVNDRTGGFVLDLKQDDFEVRDNGKVQQITQFITDAQPLSVVVLIDGSSSLMPRFTEVLDAARGFVMRMLPVDRTAIASFADRFQMRQPFSSNRDELLGHLRDEFNIRVAGETRLWDALIESVLALSSETQRRAIVVLSDGRNWRADQRPGHNGPNEVLAHALDRDVMIYAVAVWTREEDDRRTLRPDAGFTIVAQDTGGGFVEMRESDDINQLMSQISTELHQQYVLGFTPQVLDGKTHKLDVRVKRPGVNVRTRRSYVAPKGAGFLGAVSQPRRPGL